MDSKIESQFINKYKLTKLEELLPLDLHDNNGTAFKAKADFALLDTNSMKLTIFEIKAEKLGSVKTIKTCNNNLKNRLSFYGFDRENLDLEHYDLTALFFNSTYGGAKNQAIENGWNHQGAKHEAVSEELEQLDLEYIVIFNNPKKMMGNGRNVTPYKQFYEKKYKLKCISKEEFSEKYLNNNFISVDDGFVNAAILAKRVENHFEDNLDKEKGAS